MNIDYGNWSFYFGVAGFILSALGVVIAIIQTVRYHNVAEKNRELRRNRNLQIWSNISLTILAFDKLDKVQNSLKENTNIDDSIPRRISKARQSIIALWLQLLKEAAADEKDFTEKTVEEWCRLKKLENEWRREQALKLVRPKAFSNGSRNKK